MLFGVFVFHLEKNQGEKNQGRKQKNIKQK